MLKKNHFHIYFSPENSERRSKKPHVSFISTHTHKSSKKVNFRNEGECDDYMIRLLQRKGQIVMISPSHMYSLD